MTDIKKLVPCLWFDKNAEEAAKFYVSIFERSRLGRVAYYPDEGRSIHGQTAGTVLTVEFELDGQPFTALNGGPHFTLTPAVSFQIMCDTQEEIDRYWNALSAGGDESAQQCGWLKDRFGLSWQVVPTILPQLMTDADPARVARVMKAFMPMKKLILADIEAAAGL